MSDSASRSTLLARVLVIDDELEPVDLLSAVLSDSGYEVCQRSQWWRRSQAGGDRAAGCRPLGSSKCQVSQGSTCSAEFGPCGLIYP